jgi:heme exporter protein B
MERSESDAVASSHKGGFVSQVLQIVGKDLVVELRSREIIYAMVLFAVLVVIIFAFAISVEDQTTDEVAGGIVWVVVAFSGTLGLGRFFEREREGETDRALLLSPASRPAIYLGKMIGVLLFILATEAVVVPLVMLLMRLEVRSLGLLIAILLAGSVGFAAVGALFAASLMQSRSRDVLLGVLLFPIVTPVIVAGAKGTAALLGDPSRGMQGAVVWLQLLVAFDLVFVTLSMWAFGPLVRSE